MSSASSGTGYGGKKKEEISGSQSFKYAVILSEGEGSAAVHVGARPKWRRGAQLFGTPGQKVGTDQWRAPRLAFAPGGVIILAA
jgi:hypothetical protein